MQYDAIVSMIILRKCKFGFNRIYLLKYTFSFMRINFKESKKGNKILNGALTRAYSLAIELTTKKQE